MKLSIIIINYRTPEMALECIHSILSAGLLVDFEIIVVDNDSQDGSYEKLVSAELAKTRVVQSPKNGGFSYGNNFGSSFAQGDYLFFFNSDTLLKPYTLEEMIAYMDSDTNCGAITCLSVNADGIYLNNGHPFPTLGSLAKEIYLRPLIPSLLQSRYRNWKSNHPKTLCTHWDWISGSGLLMRRGDFDSVGGWDESYFMYMEDVSLCQEVTRLGKYCGVYNKLGFVHYLGDGSGSPRIIYEASRSEVIYFRMYRPKDANMAKRMTIKRARDKCRKACPQSSREIISDLRRL